MSVLHKILYRAMCFAGKPFGGIKPARLYDWLGKRAYPIPEFNLFRNRWGAELWLTHAYHIDRNILNFGCYDLDLHLALERLVKPGGVCFDVGANLGEMTLHMSKLVGPAGKVFAFEPVASIFARLEKHVAQNHAGNVSLNRIALSDQCGECTLAFADELSDNQGLASIVNVDNAAAVLRESVPALTLDRFVENAKLERLDLIKIDIQGAEIKMLEGARDTLRRLKPDLLLEISPLDLRSANKTSKDLCELIESYGYSIFELTRAGSERRIEAAKVSADFSATNVYCTQRAE